MTGRFSVPLLLAALCVGGCASFAPHDVPAPVETSAAADPVPSFGSAELQGWIDAALAQSFDVAAAVARLRQAEAAARIAGAALLPTLDASLAASRQARLGGGASVDGNLWSAGLGASYELDFWGRNRAGRDAAWADLRASAFDRDTVRLTLVAAVAGTWLQSVALRDRLAIAERNEESAARLLALVDSRTRAGAATALQLAQQRGLLATQRRLVGSLRQQALQADAALAVLAGRTARVAVGTGSLAGLRQPELPDGPVEGLLARRPDIARAEAALAAADARVSAARAAMLPRLTLSASFGGIADRPGRVLDNPLYSLAAGLAAPIFDGGRLAAGRDLALGQRAELLANYRQAIVAAYGDVDTAMAALLGTRAQAEAQAEALRQAGRALALAESRYRAGSETLLTLLDTQRTLFTAQDDAVQLHGQQLQAWVSLFRALGGLWTPS